MIAAAAPAILDATTSAAAPATPTGATGFDTVLLGLAGTAEVLDTAALDATDTQDLLSTDDSDDDDSGDDLEASLAFLSALLTAAPPMASTSGSPEDFQAGSEGAPDDGAALIALTSDGAFALDANDTSQAALELLAVKPEALEHRHAGDASQNLSRAAEILAQAQAQRPAPSAASGSSVLTHVRDPRWADDFGARVSLLVRGGESSASLALTPVDLGPVEVSVSVKDSQATIHFGAAQADTRAAIEASLPKLRELLASQGFNLLDASVSSGFSRSQQSPQGSGSGRAGGESEPVAGEAIPSVRQLGLLDLYA